MSAERPGRRTSQSARPGCSHLVHQVAPDGRARQGQRRRPWEKDLPISPGGPARVKDRPAVAFVPYDGSKYPFRSLQDPNTWHNARGLFLGYLLSAVAHVCVTKCLMRLVLPTSRRTAAAPWPADRSDPPLWNFCHHPLVVVQPGVAATAAASVQGCAPGGGRNIAAIVHDASRGTDASRGSVGGNPARFGGAPPGRTNSTRASPRANARDVSNTTSAAPRGGARGHNASLPFSSRTSMALSRKRLNAILSSRRSSRMPSEPDAGRERTM
jgi:hypothetical protein